MKKLLLLAAIFLLLILDYLALDDITTNPQPSYFWEYSMLIVSALTITVLAFFYLRSQLKK